MQRSVRQGRRPRRPHGSTWARIQQVIGAGFKIGDLQDLQSPDHVDFDVRSDGLIALSGVDYEMRRNTRTATDLTAPLLMQNGDCRETMYLNGALFACWQQIEVKKRIAKAMLCLELDFHEGFQNVEREEIPALMRYQLRGGHVSVYVDSIAMSRKYHCERVSAEDGAAILRPYGIDEMRAGLPLTLYEVGNFKIEVMDTDGTISGFGCWFFFRWLPCQLRNSRRLHHTSLAL